VTTFKIVGPLDESSAAELHRFMKRADKRDKNLNERYLDSVIAASKMLADMSRANKKNSPDPEYGEE